MLKVSELCYRYEKSSPLLKDISLHVEHGEIVALLGYSGSGKSTLLRLIAGLSTPDSGSIIIDGKAASNPKIKILPEKRHIGMVFQQPSLFPHLNVEKNILFGTNPRTAKKNKERLNELLSMMHMEKSISSYPHMLSGGEQQRIAIARALATDPKLMLLDEPFANLDVLSRKRIREETLKILTDYKVATLLVTHDPEEAFRMADRIYVMEKGRIVQHGTTQELYKKPKSPLVASLFGELQPLQAVWKKDVHHTALGKIHGFKHNKNTTTFHVRPEGIIRTSAKDGVKAKIEHIRFLGASALVYILLEGSNLRLKMRVQTAEKLNEGSYIYATLDKSHLLHFDE